MYKCNVCKHEGESKIGKCEKCDSMNIIYYVSLTPGPWAVSERIDTCIVSQAWVETDLPFLSSSANEDNQYYSGNLIAESVLNSANARLIAAAPDMLNMLETLVDSIYGPVSKPDELMETLKKAKELITRVKKINTISYK